MRAILVIGLLGILATGCGAGAPGDEPAADVAPPPASPPPARSEPEQLYEANATVIEEPGSRPMLCLGPVLLSLPPKCGDIPLAGWTWRTGDGEESYDGVKWGSFHVVGTFDGKTFTVVSAGPPEPEPDVPADNQFLPPCPEPEGGWLAGIRVAPSQEATGPAERYARSRPDYVRSWVYHVTDAPGIGRKEYEEQLPVVYVAVFTGDAARHERELRGRWAGPLCVVERPQVPNAREADRIRQAAEASLDELGLQMLASWEGELGLAAEIEVIADPGGSGQAALDERFGARLVRLLPKLRPVD